MGSGFHQIIIGAILTVFGLMVLGGWLDWLVNLVGGLTMVLGVIFLAMGFLSGRRAQR